MSVNLEFGDLPPSRRGRTSTVIGPIAEALKEWPGEWAKVSTHANPNRASSRALLLRKHGCEAAQRLQDDGTTAVWARWPEDAA